jgi:hypothetical protein
MTLKENSNGNCFEAWLHEYKVRLQQVYLQGSGNNHQSTGDSGTEQHADADAASSPGGASESYILFEKPLNV